MLRVISCFVAAFIFSSAAVAKDARWITRGTSGGPSVQIERAQISNALVVGDAVYIFDAGNDVQRQLAKADIAERNLRAVFLSHHHLDHNADVGPLIVTHWMFGSGKLGVFGPSGSRTLVSGLVSANAPTVLASFPTGGPARPSLAESVVATDLADQIQEPTLVYEDENVRVTAISVDHFQVPPSVSLPEMPRAVAYRVEAAGRSFVYSGDTGPSKSLERLAAGADVLVVEIVDLEGIAARLAKANINVPPTVRNAVVAGMRVNHLTGENVARLASAAGVKKIVLTHFVPAPEQLADPSKFVTDVRKGYAGPVVMAKDLDSF